MSSPYQVRSTPTCPRCNVALPLNETACYNCGTRLTPSLASIPVGSQKTPTPLQPERRSVQPPVKRASFVYFVITLLVIILFSYAGIHAAGFSLSSLTGPTPTHVKTSLPKESFPAPKGSPLFADGFTGDTSGWNLQSVPGNYTVNISGGTLALENDKQKLFWEPLPGTRTYDNFALMADATLTKGDANNGYGFYIRGTAGQGSELASYYRFELYGDGSYAIFKGSTDANGKSVDTKLVNFLLSSVIAKKGHANHVMIIARGSKLSFIVNNHLLQTVTDTSYTSGSIALFVSNLPEAKPGAQAQFSKFEVYAI